MARKKHLIGSHVVGMDLGATKILAAVVDEDGRIVAEAKVKTRPEKGPDAVIERMAEAAREAVHRLKVSWDAIRGVGVGAPGPVDPGPGGVHHMPNLPGWEEGPPAPQ